MQAYFRNRAPDTTYRAGWEVGPPERPGRPTSLPFIVIRTMHLTGILLCVLVNYGIHCLESSRDLKNKKKLEPTSTARPAASASSIFFAEVMPLLPSAAGQSA